MARNKTKQKHMARPIEGQNTAAWADIDHLQQHTRLPIPHEIAVRNAKEWVDTNQK